MLVYISDRQLWPTERWSSAWHTERSSQQFRWNAVCSGYNWTCCHSAFCRGWAATWDWGMLTQCCQYGKAFTAVLDWVYFHRFILISKNKYLKCLGRFMDRDYPCLNLEFTCIVDGSREHFIVVIFAVVVVTSAAEAGVIVTVWLWLSLITSVLLLPHCILMLYIRCCQWIWYLSRPSSCAGLAGHWESSRVKCRSVLGSSRSALCNFTRPLCRLPWLLVLTGACKLCHVARPWQSVWAKVEDSWSCQWFRMTSSYQSYLKCYGLQITKYQY